MLSIRDRLVAHIWFWASKSWQSSPFTLLGNPVMKLFFYLTHYSLCILTSNDLSLNVTMKSKPTIYHSIGIIIGSETIIGEGVILRAHVCIGEKYTGSKKAPYIGDGVEFGIGAKVFGDIKIKPNSIVKSNSILS